MPTLTEITNALLEKVTNTPLQEQIPTLARLVADSLNKETLSPELEWELAQGVENLLPLLEALSGQRMQIADKVLEFQRGQDRVNAKRQIENTFRWFVVPVNNQRIVQTAIGERIVQIAHDNNARIDLG